MKGGGVALKGVSLFFRIIEFCCAAVILALFSFFLANLHTNHRIIPTYEKAVEGIAGAAVLYTIFAFLLVCCLGGVAFFSLLAILLDFAFCGAFIYVAWANRNGTRGSTGIICTPLGCGDSGSRVVDSSVHIGTAHRMESAVFAVAVLGAIFFLFNILIEFGMMRHHKKEKAFGPSPNNGYTAGSPKRKFWQRRAKRDPEMGAYATKVHPDALPPHTSPDDVRASYATDTTAVGEQAPIASKYGHTTPVGQQTGHTNVPYAQQTGYAPGTAQIPAGNYHATSNSNGTF